MDGIAEGPVQIILLSLGNSIFFGDVPTGTDEVTQSSQTKDRLLSVTTEVKRLSCVAM